MSIEYDPLSAYLVIKIWCEIFNVPQIVSCILFRMVRYCDCWSTKISGINIFSDKWLIKKYNQNLKQQYYALNIYGFKVKNTICLTSKCLINASYNAYHGLFQYYIYIDQHDGLLQITQNMILGLTCIDDTKMSFWWDIKQNQIEFNDKTFPFIIGKRRWMVLDIMKKKCWLKIIIDTQIELFSVFINRGKKWNEFYMTVGHFSIPMHGKYYLQLLTRTDYSTTKPINFVTCLKSPTIVTMK